MHDKDCKGGVNRPFTFPREADRVRAGTMRPDTSHEPLTLHLLPKDAEHILLQVHRDHRTLVPNLPCELAGEKTRPATEIKDAAAGFNVPLCKAIRPVQKPSEPGIKDPGPGGREDLVVVGVRGFFWI